MFRNSSGFHFTGNVCNAERGDIILQNSDLVVHGRAGVARNLRPALAVRSRPAPYDSASHPKRHLVHDEECRGSASSSSNRANSFNVPIEALQSSYLPLEIPFPSPHINLDYPLQPSPEHNHHSQSISVYPPIYPNSDNVMALTQNSVRIGNDEEPSVPRLRLVQPRPHCFHGNLFSAKHIINGQQVNNHGESGINILHRAVALEALFDSADSSVDSFSQPKCHPETRKNMVDKLYNWALEDVPSQPIHWLHGAAGAGKSAIMRTLCELLQTSGHLGGAFFFKREHATRGNAKVLFATLAYQMALNSGRLKSLISRNAEADPSVVGRQMGVQLNKLITEPCQSLSDHAPLILLIDGLDECDTRGAQAGVLCLIRTAALQHPQKFRFLIASRPEAHIYDILKETSFEGILDSTNVEQSFEDVRTYFCAGFFRIHQEHRITMGDVPTPWPSPETVEVLVEKSSGYPIYASTVIKFIDNRFSRPTERLEAIQNLSYLECDTPFAVLDQLYIQIFEVPAQFRSRLRDFFVLLPGGLSPKQLEVAGTKRMPCIEMII